MGDGFIIDYKPNKHNTNSKKKMIAVWTLNKEKWERKYSTIARIIIEVE